MYIAKVAVQKFSSYIYLCMLVIYHSWLCDNMLGLCLSLNKEEIELALYLLIKSFQNNYASCILKKS